MEPGPYNDVESIGGHRLLINLRNICLQTLILLSEGKSNMKDDMYNC